MDANWLDSTRKFPAPKPSQRDFPRGVLKSLPALGELRKVPPSKEFEQSVAVEAPQNLAALSASSELAEQPPPAADAEQSRWARLLFPSFSDLFFLAIVMWMFVGPNLDGWSRLLLDGDAGWHIRTGEYVLDNWSVPHQDLYSFSKPGEPWYAWEWLADVVNALLFRWAGLKGVTLAAGLMLAFFATTLLRRMLWRGSNLLIALLVAFLSISAASMHYLARPHVFTLVFLSVSIWMIESDRLRAHRRIWLLVPLTAVWTNLHGGFLALIAVLALTAVGTAIEVKLGGGRTLRDAVRYTKLTLACALASLVNPYGWNLHLHVAEYLQSDWIKKVVEEFQSPSFREESLLHFEILMFAGVLVCGALFQRRRVVESLWILFWAHMALSSVRHVPIFVTIAGPIIAWEVGNWWTAATTGSKKSSLPGILNQLAREKVSGFRRTSLWPWAAAAVLAVMGSPMIWPTDFPAERFPSKIVHANLGLIARSRVLTTDQWADYLIFTNPQQKVFIDGRSDFYGPAVGKEYANLLNGAGPWRENMAERNFDVVLLRESDVLTQLLQQESNWRVVARDARAILLARF